MIKGNDYIFGFVTAFLLLMMLSASPAPSSNSLDIELIEEQKKVITQQKDCIEKIQSRQKEIARELIKIRDMLRK